MADRLDCNSYYRERRGSLSDGDFVLIFCAGPGGTLPLTKRL